MFSSLRRFRYRTRNGSNCRQWCSTVCFPRPIHKSLLRRQPLTYHSFYFEEFGVEDVWLQGLLNGAPYLCSALVGCWTTAPLNRYFGRRGCIFISCLVSFASSFWMATAHTWWNLLLARFLLGFAVGAKSTTTPVYGAECAPANIRGALVMMWQMWTAFGIMLGFIASVAFMNVTHPTIPYLQWRLMLGSTAIPYVSLQPVYGR